MDPREKEQLTKTIENAEETIERLTPDIEKCKAEQDKLQAHGQALSVRQKDAKRIKTDYAQYKTKLKNQRQKVADAEENANTDNDGEKSRRIDQIKKLIQLNIKSGEDAAKAYSEMMKSTRVITGVKMTEYGLSESLRKLT
jgi:predicted ribosome quality control (RQC) complex YloA/Tae2 family protein